MASLIVGKKTHKKYRAIALEETLGKTIEAITEKVQEGEYNPTIVYNLLFSDGTCHGFCVEGE